MIYEHQKKKYAIGMTWSDHVDMPTAKAAVKVDRKPYVMAESVSQQTSNFQTIAVGSYSGDKFRVAYSAAMAVGLVEPNTIICQSLPDGRVWFAVVHSGVPYAGHDTIVTHEQADQLIKDQITYNSTVIGDVTGAKMSLDEALQILQSHVADGRLTKLQLAEIALVQPASVARLALQGALVVVLIGLMGAAWWVYDTQLRDANARRAALSRMTKSQEEEARLQEQKKRLIEKFNAQMAAKRATLQAAQGGPVDQWRAWEQVRQALPLTVNGYTPDTMECVPAKCTVIWKGAGPGVRFVDKAALPNWVEDAEPSTAAISVFVVPAVPTAVKTWQGLDAVSLRLRIAQALQFVEGASVGAAQPLVVEAPPSPPETGLKREELGFTGEFRIGVGGDAAIIRIGQSLRELATMPVALKSVRWSMLATPEPSALVEGYWAFLSSK